MSPKGLFERLEHIFCIAANCAHAIRHAKLFKIGPRRAVARLIRLDGDEARLRALRKAARAR